MSPEATDSATVAEAAARLERTLFEVKRIIVGQDRMVERLMVCLLARGHCLLEGVPGVAKTLAVYRVAAAAKKPTALTLYYNPGCAEAASTGCSRGPPPHRRYTGRWCMG